MDMGIFKSFWNTLITNILASGEPTGFPNRVDSEIHFDADGTLFGGAARRLRIRPKSPLVEFVYYIAGTKYRKTTEYVQITNTEGLHFFYYDGSTLKGEHIGSLTNSIEVIIKSKAFVAIVYWDATNSAVVGDLLDERHGITMDGETHYQQHTTKGTYIVSGFGLGNILADQSGALDTHAQIGVTAGVFRDEDNSFSVSAITAPAAINVLYKSGASGDWRMSAANNFPVKPFSGGSGRLAYNQFTGGSWQQTEVAEVQFVLAHIFCLNGVTKQVYAIQGQNTYNSIVAARNGANTEVNNLITTGLPSKEFVFIGSIIYQTSTGYANAVKARIRTTDTGANYVNWVGSSISPVATPANHANLLGLDYASAAHTGFGRLDYVTTSNPGINNDEVDTAGIGRLFRTGDTWMNTATRMQWKCWDASTGAAVWWPGNCFSLVQDLGDVSGDINFNVANGHTAMVRITGSATLKNLTNLVAGYNFCLEVYGDGTAGRTLAFQKDTIASPTINTITWQNDNLVRHIFNAVDLSNVRIQDILSFTSVVVVNNTGNHRIGVINDGSDYCDAVNMARDSSTGDESSVSYAANIYRSQFNAPAGSLISISTKILEPAVILFFHCYEDKALSGEPAAIKLKLLVTAKYNIKGTV